MAVDDKGQSRKHVEVSGESSDIARYHPGLYRFLLRRLRGMREAEDLAQDVYIRFLQVPHHALVRRPQAYLYRIAANLVSEFSLRQKRGPVVFDSDVVEELSERLGATADEPADQIQADEHLERLERVIAQLPATYQAVLLLRVRDGLSRDAIAKKLGLSVQTVKKYLFRAIAQCRATLP
jgi:RNA polymerase sigma-70 factor (ECF subfamily)